jgi:ankyrin repeat protein
MTRLDHLPFDAPLSDYARQAGELFDRRQRDDNEAVRIVRETDAQFALARFYDFLDWSRLTDYVEAVRQPDSARWRFERAVEAVIDGDIPTLERLLKEDASLVRARSTRVTPFDPPRHGAMLLHYVASNGVEGYRQRSPKNAAAVAKLLLDAGADPDALCSLYGGECTTMALLVSSTPPANAGVQVPVLNVLIDHGAAVTPNGEGAWTSPLITALVFGFTDAARTLIDRGAPVDTLAAAAGLGRVADLKTMLPSATAGDRHRALALASQLGQIEAVNLLLDADEDPNRYNPSGTHAHSTPLHQAIAHGHLDVVRLLVERGARLDIRDTIYQGTPLGWAQYCEKPVIEQYLRDRHAPA